MSCAARTLATPLHMGRDGRYWTEGFCIKWKQVSIIKERVVVAAAVVVVSRKVDHISSVGHKVDGGKTAPGSVMVVKQDGIVLTRVSRPSGRPLALSAIYYSWQRHVKLLPIVGYHDMSSWLPQAISLLYKGKLFMTQMILQASPVFLLLFFLKIWNRLQERAVGAIGFVSYKRNRNVHCPFGTTCLRSRERVEEERGRVIQHTLYTVRGIVYKLCLNLEQRDWSKPPWSDAQW